MTLPVPMGRHIIYNQHSYLTILLLIDAETTKTDTAMTLPVPTGRHIIYI